MRREKNSSGGPTAPWAPRTPGILWQLPQWWSRIRCSPRSGLPIARAISICRPSLDGRQPASAPSAVSAAAASIGVPCGRAMAYPALTFGTT
jgi:hypothetical protein